jgi:alpha-2-macroglobulin
MALRAKRTMALVLSATMLATACSGGKSTSPTTTGPTTTPATATSTTANGSGGSGASGTARKVGPDGKLSFRLSKGAVAAKTATAVPVVGGTPLDAAAVEAILSRLSAWDDTAAARKAFSWPTVSLAVPRPGRTVDQPFPAPATPIPAVKDGPLEVVRVQPDGEVAIAPFVSITFNQPMVPIATLDQLDASTVPARITPDVKGRWQWIGTKTLRFDAAVDGLDRLPMATEFKVEIPAGTTSVNGGTLAKAATFTFRTPPPTVQSMQPDTFGPELSLTPIFVVGFDQRVDPAVVLENVSLKSGDKTRAVRLATADEIKADKRVDIGSLVDGRWIAFRPVDPLSTDSDVQVEIGKGTRSAEGPLATTETKSYAYHTYPPLKVERTNCEGGSKCIPGFGIQVEFSNELDVSKIDTSTIKVEPALPGGSISVYGSAISISGSTKAKTTYQITIPGDVVDIYGQALGKTETLQVEFGNAQPLLRQFGSSLVTVDPLAGKPSVSIGTVNHKNVRVRVFDVSPKEWPAFVDFLVKSQQGDPNGPKVVVPGWPVLFDKQVNTSTKSDELVETTVDLSAQFGSDNLGHVVVIVDPTEKYDPNSELFWMNRPTMAWVQSTKLGVDALSSNRSLRVWTTELATGAPVAGVKIAGTSGAPVATSADDGTAVIDLQATTLDAIVATNGSDTAILSRGDYNGGWGFNPIVDQARWYVVDDRHVYRPGEKVSIKGWVRRFEMSGDAQVHLPSDGGSVAYQIFDGAGVKLAEGSAALNPLGGFDVSFDVPAGANLGPAFAQLTVAGVPTLLSTQAMHQFSIEQFRRPEFEVVTHAEGTAPVTSTQAATVTADAQYYAGGGLGAAPVTWQVTTSSAHYAPPGWDQFSFGEWTPWWFDFGNRFVDYTGESGFKDAFGGGFNGGFGDSKVEEFSGTTDASGSNHLKIDFEGANGVFPDLPVTVRAQANVEDVNRQQWGSNTNLLVHPADFYVGLQGTATFVKQGDPLDINAIVTDIDGKAVAGRAVTVTANRVEWKTTNGEWKETLVDPQNCDKLSATGAVLCSFTTAVGGTYKISATISDDRGGRSRSELTRWVTGAESRPTRNLAREELTIVPDKKSYAPGDTAKLLVQAPFATGHGIVAISRVGIEATQVFELDKGTAIVSVPIADRDIPQVNIAIEVAGTARRNGDDGRPLADAPARPALAVGSLSLEVSTASRALKVAAVPRAKALKPGESTQVDVAVTDPTGTPVSGAEFAVVVADEAVLALSKYSWTDPRELFYGPLQGYVDARYGRESIILANPENLSGNDGDATGGASPATTAAAASATTKAADSGRDSAKSAAPVPAAAARPDIALASAADTDQFTNESRAGGSAAPPGSAIDVRTNFDSLAVFRPTVTTDTAGKAVIDVKLPDNLTRYRVMVVAVNGADQFGSGESTITARLPLMVRPSAPRFLNFGDTFELPVVLQNQTDAAMEVDVAIQTANLKVTGAAGARVSVPANDRVEVRFPMAAVDAGTAKFRVAAVSGSAADAATVELPVYTPATTEAFATYGVIDSGTEAQPILAPTGVIPQFGGLDVSTSSTALQGLTDAVLSIVKYPYDSAEAHASRLLTITSLRDVLSAFDASALPSAAALDSAMAADVAGIVSLQGDDGGFGFWERNGRSDPYATIEVTQALLAARTAGISVPQGTVERALGALANIENLIPSTYGEAVRDTLGAYALHVRNVGGQRDTQKAQDLWNRRGPKMSVEAIAWLWPVIDDQTIDQAIERRITNSAVETAAAANFTTSYGDDAYLVLSSNRRADGVVLDALIAKRPTSSLIPKVVTGLLSHRVAGAWSGSQENTFILLALKKYFDTYEKQTPAFVARIWLGDKYAGDQSFDGRSTDRLNVNVPTAELVTAGNTSLIVSKEGTGRLYYRVGLTYAPSALTSEPRDRGFVVTRTYEAVDNPSDVSRDANGVWHVKAGANVRVKLTMVAESQRTHVALIDPVPAGFEIVNPSLATSPSVKAETPIETSKPSDTRWWYGTWFDHQNRRDEQAEAFASFLPAGTYDYSYVARATTPGSFVVPPTKAEQIYEPETFGRSASTTVVVDR